MKRLTMLLLMHILLLPLTADAAVKCGAFSCVEFNKGLNDYTTLSFRTKSHEPMLCYAHVEGVKTVFKLNYTATLYLRQGHNVANVSWRCDPIKDNCPRWGKSYCATNGIT